MWFSHDPLAEPEPLIRRVYAYVAYQVGEGALAEDITSEVMERAVRYRSSYDRRSGTPVAWVLGIARRVVADRASQPQTAPLTDDIEQAPADLADSTSDRVTIRAALSRLSDRDRELLLLRYAADLRAREIAAILELETHAVEVALSRALARLREVLTATPTRSA